MVRSNTYVQMKYVADLPNFIFVFFSFLFCDFFGSCYLVVVTFGMVTERRTAGKQCIRIHCALAQMGLKTDLP